MSAHKNELYSANLVDGPRFCSSKQWRKKKGKVPLEESHISRNFIKRIRHTLVLLSFC
jgi:hypothetical protein